MVEANVRKNMFLLKKLVKDKRFEDFEKRKWGINEKCIANSKEELIKALHAKAAEEIKELDDACAKENNIDKISSELADVQQVVQDLSSLGEGENIKKYTDKIASVCEYYGIAIVEVLKITQANFEKDGGFLGGHYVNRLEIPERDDRHQYFVDKYGIHRGL